VGFPLSCASRPTPHASHYPSSRAAHAARDHAPPTSSANSAPTCCGLPKVEGSPAPSATGFMSTVEAKPTQPSCRGWDPLRDWLATTSTPEAGSAQRIAPSEASGPTDLHDSSADAEVLGAASAASHCGAWPPPSVVGRAGCGGVLPGSGPRSTGSDSVASFSSFG